MKQYDILIIGGGISGLTAAIYAARAKHSVCVLEREVCGGLVNYTNTIKIFRLIGSFTVWNSWRNAANRPKLSTLRLRN